MPIGSMSIQCKHRDKRDKDCMIHLMYTSNQSERVHTCTGHILLALYIHYILHLMYSSNQSEHIHVLARYNSELDFQSSQSDQAKPTFYSLNLCQYLL